jgi:hypothetical protein
MGVHCRPLSRLKAGSPIVCKHKLTRLQKHAGVILNMTTTTPACANYAVAYATPTVFLVVKYRWIAKVSILSVDNTTLTCYSSTKLSMISQQPSIEIFVYPCCCTRLFAFGVLH